ncbi:proteasomal ubiquitin receptor ADRM1-like isoform X2 [Xenia sp. Carnegie-2017]|uniref:proteasomal ubiquitin receptor ADRM1-like isoform X2 n=1 Tax=Xenia sp. Carnegie-2017 TaxID=2897299 RepID=UPI001F03457E|nr:proteasomal ubiquitin receptor ADRM1-like isoform X2 [Xenia sp. Carnegie-2017]
MTSTGTALFGSNIGNTSKNLVEFRAGKMKLNGTTVTADKRKGLVYIYQGDDSLMHFCWKDRTTGTVEDDLIIFPDDVEYKPVKQCKTGRVFILKFKISSRKLFFWMQEPKSNKDEELMKKVNDFLNNPPAPGSSGGGLRHLGDQLIGDASLQGLIGNLDQQQLLQLLGSGQGMSGLSSLAGLASRGSSASSTTATASKPSDSEPPATGSSKPEPEKKPAKKEASSKADDKKEASTGSAQTPAVQLSDLQNILSNMAVPKVQQTADAVDLNYVITPENLAPMLSNPEFRRRLIPFLPAGEDLPQEESQLLETLKSPHFQQSLHAFSAALQSGQLGPIMSQFQLPQNAIEAFNRGDVQAVAQALQENSKVEENKEPEKDDDDDDMGLD